MLECGPGRHHQPFVGQQVLPAGEGQTATGLGRLGQVGEGGDRIVEEHHTEAADDAVEGCRGQRVDLGIALLEARLVEARLRGTAAGHPEHGPGQVEAEHRAIGADPARHFQRHRAVSAADVEDRLARRRRERLHDQLAVPTVDRVVTVGLGNPVMAR